MTSTRRCIIGRSRSTARGVIAFRNSAFEAVVIGVVAIKEPAVVVLDDVAKSLWIGARQIGIERLDPIDAQVRPVLQFEDVAIAREVPGLRLFRPMHRLRSRIAGSRDRDPAPRPP